MEATEAYLAKLKADMNNPKYHLYNRCRRVWAQKPYRSEKTSEQEEQENAA